jgi:hypothetical protein
VGKPEGKRPFGWPRRRWENNIKINIREEGWVACNFSTLLSIGTGGGVS